MQPPSVIRPLYVLNLPAFGARNRPAGSSAYRHSRLAPTNPEFMPPLGPQYYEEGAGYDAPTATVRPATLAVAIRDVIRQAVDHAVNVAGYAIVALCRWRGLVSGSALLS